MRRHRLRKRLKWACTVAMGAAVGLSVFSGFCTVWLGWGDDSWDWGGCLSHGLLTLQRRDRSGESENELEEPPPPLHWGVRWDVGWDWGRLDPARGDGFATGWDRGLIKQENFGIVGTSVGYPVALIAIPTGLLWYADRRRFGRGRCAQCGYERAGLGAGAVCPECGGMPST